MPYSACLLPAFPCTSDMWDSLANEKRPIVVYGMGNGADKLISRLDKYGVRVADFFASDGFVRGHSFHGKRVKSFSEIREEYQDFVILLSFASNRPDVVNMLKEINDSYDMLVPDMPVADESEYFDREFYNTHYAEIKSAYEALADEESKACFAAVINYRLTGKMSYLLGAYSEKQELYDLIGKGASSYVDAGAYNGDTLKEAIEYFPSLKSVIAIEPDRKNFKKLEKYVATLEGLDVNAVNAAAYSECGITSFAVSGNRNSSVNSTASFEHKTEDIALVTVDSLVNCSVDFIKYDVEGAEQEALLGSAQTIKSYSPTLLVSLYHRSRDIFSLVNYMAKTYGDRYKFYIRRLFCLPAWEIDLIACNK